MSREERNDRLWILARKRAKGEMTKEDEVEKVRLQDEQDEELHIVETSTRETLKSKLIRFLGHKS